MEKLTAILLFLFMATTPCLQGQTREEDEGLLSGEGRDSLLYCSLLTCAQGPEIYQYYGHSALRIKNPQTGEDIIYNYGVFDFQAPNFIWRFVLGETEYIVATAPTASFIDSYMRMGILVSERRLNLNQDETQRLKEILDENCKPENRAYHYNFFYDNCATRIRDKIEACLDGKLEYQNTEGNMTLRDIVHQYSKEHPWAYFGQDLLIGAEADSKASRQTRQFSPLYLENDLSQAVITGNRQGTRQLCTGETFTYTPPIPAVIEKPLISPLMAFCILLIITLIISAYDYCKRKVSWIFDLILLTIQGLAGILVTFMLFFSIHPTVDTNWQAILFNPLPLVFLYWTIKAERKNKTAAYHKWSPYLLAIFLIITLTGIQDISREIQLFTICLLMRSLTCNIVSHRQIPLTSYQ